MMRITLKNTVLGTGLLLATAPVMAALVTISGNTVDFIYDTDDIDPLFGSIYVSGDSIFATPTNFNVSSDSAVNPLSAMGTIQIRLKSGYQFAGIGIGEGGTYNITGTGSVGVDASLRLFDWNAPVPGFGTAENMTLSSSTDFTLNDGVSHSWQASGSFDMTTTTWDGITHVGLSLTNILSADAGTDGWAYIDKNAVGAVGFTVNTVVPVPAAVWLFGSGLIGLVAVARRKETKV